MSWSRQVKTYFAAAFIMVASIIFSIIISTITNSDLSLDVFVIAFLVQFAISYLMNSGKNKWISLFLPMVPVIIYELVFYQFKIALITIAFVFLLNLIFTNKYNNIVDYEWYKSVLIKSVYVVFIASTIGTFFNERIGLSLYRYLIIYFILMTICLREALGYSYHIKKNNRARVTNCILVVSSILLTREGIYNFIKSIVVYIVELLKIGLGKVIDILSFILEKPFESIFEFLTSIMVNDPGIEGIGGTQKAEAVNEMVEFNPIVWIILGNCLKIILIIVIILLVFKAIKKISVFDNDTRYEDYIEVIEEINIIDERKKVKNINNFFRKKGDSRQEVIYSYERFVTFGTKKGLLKRYMTPKQIENIVKISTEDSSDFKDATRIYNEAKFSLHNINKENEKNVKNVIGRTIKKF